MHHKLLLLAIAPFAIGCASTDQETERDRRLSNSVRDQGRREEMHRRVDERMDALAGQLRREMHQMVDEMADGRRRPGGQQMVFETSDGRNRAAEGVPRGRIVEGPAAPTRPIPPNAPGSTEPRPRATRTGRAMELNPNRAAPTSRPAGSRVVRRISEGDGADGVDQIEVDGLDFKVILDRARREVERGEGVIEVAPHEGGSGAEFRRLEIGHGPMEVVPGQTPESRPMIRRRVQ